MTIQQGIISIFVLLFAISVHEASHGWAALKMGDPTAHQLGRITLNPIRHIDPIGTILFPLMLIVMRSPFLFGWAKPVPVNPLNLKNPRKDNLIISIAGPVSNIAVAVVAFIILKIILNLNPSLFYGGGFGKLLSPIIQILYLTILLNVILAVFNLIPIPPLDGSGVVMGLISEEAAEKYEQIRPYGFFILILLLMTGLIGRILGAVQQFVNALL
jgi:Zn-dependent protease